MPGKMVITGAGGMLGSNLLKGFASSDVVGFDSEALDVTDRNNVFELLTREQPGCIIHTAAYTNVEACETDPDKAFRVNVLGTQNLVEYAAKHDVMFVYISSTGIYGTAEERSYTEFDPVVPTTVHHRSKYEGEKVVERHLNRFLIIRTGWLFGGELGHAKNFVYKRFLESQSKAIMYSDPSQKGNPTYIGNLVNQIALLLDTGRLGIYNCVDHAENVTRFDYVQEIVALFGSDCRVEVAPEGLFKRVAPVSANESARNYKLELEGLDRMSSWKTSLKAYVEKLKEEL